MKIENNPYLFYVTSGLILSGANAYDHDDDEVASLAESIMELKVSDNILNWFSRARTGQVEVNPYWPRGSVLTIACFFVENGHFNIDDCLTFITSTGAMNDPVGEDDFRLWISELPVILSYFGAKTAIQPLWMEYCRIIDSRMPRWNIMMDEAKSMVNTFFGEKAPEMVFAPNLFAAYSTDFVHMGNKVITISSEPDGESLIHETLHTVVALYRDKIMAFAEKNGLSGFADSRKMVELGYMIDDSSASVTHAIEECLVRGVSVMLAGKDEKRLQAHAEYGFDSVPLIGEIFNRIQPDLDAFRSFIDAVLVEMKGFM